MTRSSIYLKSIESVLKLYFLNSMINLVIRRNYVKFFKGFKTKILAIFFKA